MIELKHVSKVFETAGGRVEALKDISLTIPDGDVYGIIGMSGAGKSTLVRCINMLERPTSGEVIVNGKRLDTMSPAQLRAARRDITMIFQRFNLLMQRNCLDNVCFPMELAGVSRREAASRAQELLETVGLPDKAKAYPAQLSGGQQQRVAIARALAENKRVFVDVTADWCVTCKANKYNVLLRDDVQDALSAPDVVALRGDWSRPSDTISQFLTTRGSAAVPFNQIYGPGLPQGHVLPALLSREAVLSTLSDAKGK